MSLVSPSPSLGFSIFFFFLFFSIIAPDPVIANKHNRLHAKIDSERKLETFAATCSGKRERKKEEEKIAIRDENEKLFRKKSNLTPALMDQGCLESERGELQNRSKKKEEPKRNEKRKRKRERERGKRKSEKRKKWRLEWVQTK